MASKRKAKARSTTHSPTTLVVKEQPGETPARSMARAMMAPEVQAAATIQTFAKSDYDLQGFIDELSAQIDAVNAGDMKRAEGILITQAHTLNELFHALAHRAAMNMGEYFNAAERYMRLALKAQSQCRATLETLSAIKHPPVVYARQANIAHGHQQVNNGIPSRTRETEIGQSKQSGADSELLPDTRASETESGVDTPLETVGEIDRTKVGRG
jgi:hypothetical protein